MNDVHRLAEHLLGKSEEIVTLLRDKLPVIVGRMAKDHYQKNFRLGGFVNNGLQEWKKPQRFNAEGKSAASRYGTLLSSRRHLFSSFNYNGANFRTRVWNPVPYASAHNDGETVTVPVTDKMRKMGWARYFAAGGGKEYESKVRETGNQNEDAEKWKRFALTTKKQLKIKMPERPILKESAELNTAINNRADADIHKLIDL